MIPRTRDQAASLVRGTRNGELRRRDAVGVEDRVDVAQRREQAPQRFHVAHFRDVPVLRELVLDVAAVLDDVRAVLGERPRDVLEQPRAVPRVDRDLHPEALRRAAVPGDVREALRVPLQRLHVRAVLAVDRDALPERDVADDLVAGERRAALRQPDEHVVDPANGDAEVLAQGRVPRLRRLERDRLLLRDLLRLQALDHLVDDVAGLQLPGAERDVEVLGLLEAGLANHLSEHRRALQLAVGQVLLLQRALERLATLGLGLLARLAREPLADLVAGPRGGRQRKPVARGPAPALRGQDLDEVAALQTVVERDDPAVDLRADGAVADVCVDGVGEVDRRRAGGQRLDLALRSEHIDLVLEEIGAEGLDELARVRLVLLPVHQLAHPGKPLVVACLAGAAMLVEPVRGDAELRRLVHFARAHLDLERPAFRSDHGRVQRLVAVQLRHGDVVLEAAGHRLPERVDQTERAVAVARPLLAAALRDHAHRREVVDLVELAALLGHLVVDRIEVLRAPRDVGGDVDLLELALQRQRRLAHVLLTVGPALADQRLDLVVLARVESREGQILELPLDLVDPEAMSERGVDLERLLGLLHLLLLAQVLDRAHVVEPVRELDQDHADVLRHRHDHLAVVLGLRLLAALELNPRQLRNALDELRDLVAELRSYVLDVGAGVLDHVVQERGGDRLLVQVELGADPGGAPRMVDEVLAGAALLALVRRRGETEGAGEQVAVDVAVVGSDALDQLVDELLVPFSRLDDRHEKSVLPPFPLPAARNSSRRRKFMRPERWRSCANDVRSGRPRGSRG